MLKADLHLHTREDPTNNPVISHDYYQLIDHAAALGFEVLAITPFSGYVADRKVYAYAKKKGILLLPGTERQIEGYEVLCINITKNEFDSLHTFNDVKRIKSKNNLFIAPHPFYIRPGCLGKKLVENINLFDGIEYSHFYVSILNLNRKAVIVARKYHKPLIGTSDAHKLKQMNYTYALIDSTKDAASVVAAIKAGKVKLVTRSLPILLFLHIAQWNLTTPFRYAFRKLFK